MEHSSNGHKQPPKLFLRFFRWYCHPKLMNHIEGDLMELYRERAREQGKRRADIKFIIDVLLLFRPGIIRPAEGSINPNAYAVYGSYFKIGWRNLVKSKGSTMISVSGMVVGMTCFMLIALFIQYELSYDKQHKKADRIFRVAQIQKDNEHRGSDRFANAPMPLAPALRETFPEVEAATTVSEHKARFIHNGAGFYEKGLYADEYFFDVFSFPIIEGTGKESLSDPNSIILTESLAKKYFGVASPIGKTIQFENERLLTVRGVAANVPQNQHITFDYITSLENVPWFEDDRDQWASNNYRVYLVLPEKYDYKDLERRLTVFDSHVEKAYSGLPFKARYFLQPLLDIHLHSHINFESKPTRDIKYIYLAASIAYIILLLALINYVNLAIVHFNRRSKEVGVRKVLGAGRKQVIIQFLSESFLITILSFATALAFSYALLPQFNNLLGLTIPYDLEIGRFVFAGLVVSAIALAGLSGLYPAIYSSIVSPIDSLKGGWYRAGNLGQVLKSTLVLIQFTAAIVLTFGSIVISNQLGFIQNKKLGFERNEIVYIPYQQQNVFDKISTLSSELLKNPRILNVSLSSDLPLNSESQGLVDRWEGNTEGRELRMYRTRVDYNYIDVFQIEMAEGRNFSPGFPSDSSGAYILNEAAVEALGWSSVVGKSFEDGIVVGVVKNFHFQPFNYSIEPMYMNFINPRNSYFEGNIILKISPGEKRETLTYVQRIMKDMMPDMPFTYLYLDESYSELYESEQRFGWIMNLFTGIAIFIAGMGLFGLINQNVAQRIKEIGIRKVLGASVINILVLLSKGFMKLFLIAAFVAFPVAYYLGNQWLRDFAYRIDMAWWMFTLAGAITASVALAAICFKAVNAALMNPVNSLKSE
ncbi:MAG TPA: ABC transporter permease [Cyclobacteriaceae bacterium]